MKKLLFAIFLSASTLSSFAAAVRTLPEPDADGYYVFGAPYTYSGTSSYEWKADANTPAYPVWSDMAFPAGAKIKLTGGVIIDSWPTGVTEVDCSGLTFMAITATKAIPAGVKIVIPTGAKLCVCKGTTTVADDGTVTWAESANTAINLQNDLELNGTLYWYKNTLTISGTISGEEKSAEISLSASANTPLNFSGTFAYRGKILTGGTAQNVLMTGACTVGSFEHLYLKGQSVLSSKPSYSYFMFNPATISEPDFKIGSLRFNAADVSDGSRRGSIVALSGGRKLTVGDMGGSSAHFITQTTTSPSPSDTVGDAVLSVANLDPCPEGSGWSSGTKTFNGYVGRGISLGITKIGENVSRNVNRTVNLHYGTESGINTNFLSIGAVASGSASKYMTVTVDGPTPAALPRTVSLPLQENAAGGVDVSVTGTEWAFDFDWTKDDPNLSRCEITGAKNATIPENGTIAITTNGKPGAKTVYPLFTCNVGCAALADAAAWPVTINGTLVEGDEFSDGTAKYKIIRSETGIYLQANIIKGLMLILR